MKAKKQFISFGTSKSLSEIQGRFKYYKLALYLYSFSSFLDIMLLKNFDSKYLEAIRSKIEAYSIEYNSFYEQSMEGVEQIATTSIQSRTLQGLSAAGKFIGKQIGKIPDKDNKIKIDDKLIEGSGKLDSISQRAVEDTMDAFASVQDHGIQLFVVKIGLINRMFNEPLRLYVGAENLYLSTT